MFLHCPSCFFCYSSGIRYTIVPSARRPAAAHTQPSFIVLSNQLLFHIGMLLCDRCPSGFVIEDNTQIRTDPSLCVAPPGWCVHEAWLLLLPQLLAACLRQQRVRVRVCLCSLARTHKCLCLNSLLLVLLLNCFCFRYLVSAGSAARCPKGEFKPGWRAYLLQPGLLQCACSNHHSLALRLTAQLCERCGFSLQLLLPS